MVPKKGLYRVVVVLVVPVVLMVLVVLVFVVLEVPGFEIRILREISSPEPAGNVLETSGTAQNSDFFVLSFFGGSWWFWCFSCVFLLFVSLQASMFFSPKIFSGVLVNFVKKPERTGQYFHWNLGLRFPGNGHIDLISKKSCVLSYDQKL